MTCPPLWCSLKVFNPPEHISGRTNDQLTLFVAGSWTSLKRRRGCTSDVGQGRGSTFCPHLSKFRPAVCDRFLPGLELLLCRRPPLFMTSPPIVPDPPLRRAERRSAFPTGRAPPWFRTLFVPTGVPCPGWTSRGLNPFAVPPNATAKISPFSCSFYAQDELPRTSIGPLFPC